MKEYFTHTSRISFLFILWGIVTHCYSQTYGDTIFWENFGNGAVRTDITGLGKIGGMYKYEGALNYVYATNSQKLTDYKSTNPSKDYITDSPTFQEVPLLTTEAQYSFKPTTAGPAWTSTYFTITSWRNRTFSAATSGSTETLAAWDDTNTGSGYESQIPCAWIWVDNSWKFGFYYITYENTARCAVPDDGHYAIVKNLDLFNCPGDVNWLPDNFRDHTGFTNDTLSPITSSGTRVSSGDDSRMLFVNCAAVTGISSPVYKRMVTELCRDGWFEFSIWYASVQTTTNNSQFRIEFWNTDPGNDPSLGNLDASYEGQSIALANGSKLLKVGDKTTLGVSADLGKWYQIKEHFKLTGQDYVWVVVRNFGQGGSGNDIVLDDLVFKPWAPFDLSLMISTISLSTACTDGIVTLMSSFPNPSSFPGYVNIKDYSFYFEGLNSSANWIRLGSSVPLKTESTYMPLELSIPVAEYMLYSKFRISVASSASGFGGKCITFTNNPTDNVAIPSTPSFVLSGNDVCDDNSGTQKGYFKIKNTNQSSCEGWSVRVKMPNGSTQTFTPDAKTSCP